MVIPIERPWMWIGARDDVFRIGARIAGIFEDREAWIVQDVHFSFQILETKNRVKVRRENSAATIWMKGDNSSVGRVRGCIDIHGILSDEDASIGRGTNHGRMTDVRRGGDQLEFPRCARNRRIDGGKRLQQRKRSQENEDGRFHEFCKI